MLSRRILLFNALGVALLLSWALPSFTLWTYLDDGVFWFFNHTISDNHPRWNVVLAALNNRKYDMLIMLAMLVTMAAASYRDQQGGFRRWFGIGVTMLITAGLINELVRTVVTYSHPSPTRFFDDANLLSQFVHFATKDQAGNSFPGDHGIMAMIFAAFMLTFGDRLTRIVRPCAGSLRRGSAHHGRGTLAKRHPCRLAFHHAFITAMGTLHTASTQKQCDSQPLCRTRREKAGRLAPAPTLIVFKPLQSKRQKDVKIIPAAPEWNTQKATGTGYSVI